MKKTVKRIAYLAAAAVFTTGMAFGAPMNVKVKNITGKVETQSGSAWQAVTEGGSVAVGSPIRTGPGSSCILVWAGGNTVKVGPLTNMKVASAEKDATGKENSMIELKSGKLVAHAKKLPTKNSSFKVSTPTAVAGVRGTDEMIETQENGESSFGVAAGSVELESGGQTIVLDEGFMVDVDTAGAMSVPEAIPPEMMEAVKEDLKEVNSEAKQAEVEAGGKSEAAPPAGEKKENAAAGGDKAEKAEKADKEDKGGDKTEKADKEDKGDKGGDKADKAEKSDKEETASAGGDKSEPKAEAKEETATAGGDEKTYAKEETATSGDDAGDTSVEESEPAAEVDMDAATANIDSAMDTAVNADVTDTAQESAEEAFPTGNIDVIVDFYSTQ